MRTLFFIGFLLSNFAFGKEIIGEWSRCDIQKYGVSFYTTVFTKKFRYEIVMFGAGRECDAILTNPLAAGIIVSKITQKNNKIVHERISEGFIAFNEETRALIGAPKVCNVVKWAYTFDRSCEFEGIQAPEFRDLLLKDLSRPIGKSYQFYEYKKFLYADIYPKEGLYKTNAFYPELIK